jgi:hypothetical protein
MEAIKITMKLGAWWFIPIILAIWETEIGRIKVQVELGQLVPETPIYKMTKQGVA